jgi:hypothetical protein
LRFKPRKYDGFISYRHATSGPHAHAIESKIKQRFKKQLFIDVVGLKSGHYEENILKTIGEVDHFIILLTPGCLEKKPEDLFLKEIAHAIALKKNIIPVMIDNFKFPPISSLPEDIRDLDKYEAIPYDHTSFESAIKKIASFIDEYNERSQDKGSSPLELHSFEKETCDYLISHMWRHPENQEIR